MSSYLRLRQRHAFLSLIFTATILVTGFADFVGLEEQYLRHAIGTIIRTGLTV